MEELSRDSYKNLREISEIKPLKDYRNTNISTNEKFRNPIVLKNIRMTGISTNNFGGLDMNTNSNGLTTTIGERRYGNTGNYVDYNIYFDHTTNMGKIGRRQYKNGRIETNIPINSSYEL